MGYIIPKTPRSRSTRRVVPSRRVQLIRIRKGFHQKQNKVAQPRHISVKRLLRYSLPQIVKRPDAINNGEAILPWPNEIKKSYVISIRKHRLQAFQKRMGPWSKHVTHVPGTVGAHLNARQIHRIKGNQKRFSRGQMGCYDSHVRVWKKIVENNCATLVMEDDASIFYEEELSQRFAHLFQQLESKKIRWDFIYLGTYETSVINKPVAQGIYPCTEWHGLFCYLIKPSAAKVFLKKCFPMTCAVDVYLRRFMGSLNFYKAVPRFGFVVSLTSDTRK